MSRALRVNACGMAERHEIVIQSPGWMKEGVKAMSRQRRLRAAEECSRQENQRYAAAPVTFRMLYTIEACGM